MPENSALDLRAMQEQNRAALMDAITRRNDLHVEVERLEQRTATLEREATEALRDGNRGTAKLRLQAKVAADQELQTRRGELAGIETNVEEVKRSIRDLEDLLKMQPPEAPKPSTISASASVEEMPPFPDVLSDTLDHSCSGRPRPAARNRCFSEWQQCTGNQRRERGASRTRRLPDGRTFCRCECLTAGRRRLAAV